MDYVVGSVADLISGNVSTPNRPRIVKRALTPVKRQQSPNVTPKSEFVDDRSIFLSPSVQKKKAVVKKSPKRIFEASNLDQTIEGDDEPKLLSPKAEKVKKHLKNELENSSSVTKSPKSPKSPKKRISEVAEQSESKSPKKQLVMAEEGLKSKENTPKMKKQKKNSISEEKSSEVVENVSAEVEKPQESKSSKKRKRKNSKIQSNDKKDTKPAEKEADHTAKKPKKKHNKFKNKPVPTDTKEITESNEKTKKPIEENKETSENIDMKKKKNRKKKSKKPNVNQASIKQETSTPEEVKSNVSESNNNTDSNSDDNTEINPNAITNEDTDSEHDTDDEIESVTEQENNEILDTGPAENSDDDEEEETPKPTKAVRKQNEKLTQENKEDDVKRTLFVGNVPFSTKCKKEIKKIFSKYGTIETVRIRTVPVKDARVTPKLAVIKNELHPDRSTVNVYVKFKEPASVYEALKENNVELNGCHLRVSRSDTTGAEHDPKCSVFVGNLPFAIEDETLRSKFESCGEIESVRIIRDKKTNAGKGFGYVNFASKDGVELALNLSEEDLTIKNRIIRVKRCTLTNKQGNRQTNTGNQGRSQGNNQKGFGNSSHDRGNVQNNFGNNKFGNKERNFGNRNANRFENRNGNDRFANKNGNDRFANRNGNDRFANRNGNDRFANRNGNDRFANKNGNDRFANRSGNDRFANKDGNNKFNNNSFGNDKGGNEKFDGAFRRLENKRQNQESGDGPNPKKQRKEFVGMTAEKKKKRTFDKGQKKKKALSEILTK